MGKITDDKNEVLPGVTVLIKGTNIGTTTNVNGSYSIPVPGGNNTLLVSYIGYQTQEIAINSRTEINISLIPDAKALEEVVVVGYGTQRKSDITGSVAVVDAAEMKKYATNDVAQLLQGRAPGVVVTSDGQPGATPSVRIRGFSTFGDAQPLYVVDGVPVGTSVRDFNPNDIESGASAERCFCRRYLRFAGGYGVVIITTKQGRKNTPLRVEYNGYYGIDNIAQCMPVTNRENYQMLNNEARVNAGRPLAPANDPSSPVYITNVDTDWQKKGLKTGSRQNHNLGFSGGGANITYNVSLDYFDNPSTFVGNGPSYKRYTGRVNTTAEKGIFKIGQILLYAHSNENWLTNGGDILLGGRP